MKGSRFSDMTPCSLLKVNRRFGGTYRLHLQDQRIILLLCLNTCFHAGILLGLFLDPEDGGYIFLDFQRTTARRKNATCTGEHKHRINTEKHACLERDSKSRYQRSSGWRQFMPQIARPQWSALFSSVPNICLYKYLSYKSVIHSLLCRSILA
jgi:hypothetical protein